MSETQIENPSDKLSPLTERERQVYAEVEQRGVRPIASSLSAQMFQLFLEGYSCSEIAKINKGLTEGDIVYCRIKNNWDVERDRYAEDLHKQIREKLLKQKLESLEFLTNMLAVTHKEHRDQTLKYLQTGNPDDKPQTWVNGSSSYKAVLEAIQKLTGEDKVQKQHITTESTVTVKTDGLLKDITPEKRLSILKKINDKKDAKD